MKVIAILAVFVVLSAYVSAHVKEKTGDDECAPEPTCHQCINGAFPADLCCKDVKTYHKLNLANAKDCASYYTCVNDHAILRQCPKGLHWSIESDRCEFPKDAKCAVATKRTV